MNMNHKMLLAFLILTAFLLGCKNPQSNESSTNDSDPVKLTCHILYSKSVDSTVYVDSSGTPTVLMNYHGALDTTLHHWAWADTLVPSQNPHTSTVKPLNVFYSDSSLLDSSGKPIVSDSLLVHLDTLFDTLSTYDSVFLTIPQALLKNAQQQYSVAIEGKNKLHIYLDTIYAGRSRNHEILAQELPGDSLMLTLVNAPDFIKASYYNYCEDAPDTSYVPAKSIRYHVSKDNTCNYNQAVIRYEIRNPSLDTTFQWSLILASRWGTKDTMEFTTKVVPVFGY